MQNKSIWASGEWNARKYLMGIGYKIIEENCKIGGSEIDFVCKIPKKPQKIKLIKDFKQNKKDGIFETKIDEKFMKGVLKNSIRELEDILVFVEVKARSSKKFGEPFEAVGKNKQHNIARGAMAYIKKNSLENMKTRIDVVSIVDDDIEHIENAFDINIY